MNHDAPQNDPEGEDGEGLEDGQVAVMEAPEQNKIPETIDDEMWYEGAFTPEQIQIKQRFESEVHGEMATHDKENFFHLSDQHIGEVKGGARKFAYIIGRHRPELLTPEVKAAIDGSAEEHDSKINWIPVNGKRVRLRGNGVSMPKNIADLPVDAFPNGIKKGNEELSADFGYETAQKNDPGENPQLYTERVLHLKRKGTEATYPDVVPTELLPEDLMVENPENHEMIDISKYFPANAEGKRILWMFTQPSNIEDNKQNQNDDLETKFVKLSVGTGDLNYEGEVDFGTYKKRGNQEEQEIQEQVRADLKKGISELTSQRKMDIVKDDLTFVMQQIGFAVGGRRRGNDQMKYSSVINGAGPEVAEAIKTDIRSVWKTFDSNILDSIGRHEKTQEKYGKLLNAETYKNEPELANALIADFYMNEMGYDREEVNI